MDYQQSFLVDTDSRPYFLDRLGTTIMQENPLCIDASYKEDSKDCNDEAMSINLLLYPIIALIL